MEDHIRFKEPDIQKVKLLELLSKDKTKDFTYS
jgi:hypothetical protein